MKFTPHILWTPPSLNARAEKCDVVITRELQDRFRKTLAASETALKEKLKTFEPLDISEAATRSLVR